jgi:hypothetical protein
MSYARNSDPETSWEAAESLTSDYKNRIRDEVLQFATEAGPEGFTDVEMQQHFNDFGSSYRTRRSELSAEGLIVPTTQRRKTPSGRNAIVHVHRVFVTGNQQLSFI